MLTKKYSETEAKCKVTFTLPIDAIKGAKQVDLLGDFNEWNPSLAIPMRKLKDHYKITLELPTGRDYQFRYIGDNGLWENDWAADNYVPSPFDDINNSVLSLEESAGANSVSDTKNRDSGTATRSSRSSSGKKDDLKRIEGIGPKIAEILNTAGIIYFEDLAASDVTTLKAILENAGNRYKMHDPSTWGIQAKLAASRNWVQLKKLQDELNGGKLK